MNIKSIIKLYLFAAACHNVATAAGGEMKDNGGWPLRIVVNRDLTITPRFISDCTPVWILKTGTSLQKFELVQEICKEFLKNPNDMPLRILLAIMIKRSDETYQCQVFSTNPEEDVTGCVNVAMVRTYGDRLVDASVERLRYILNSLREGDEQRLLLESVG
ncbi:MAG: hypothetical protein LBM19_01230 [Holosporales bacterium]|jgi:hypothetical protein|nr:hypothetical protein [Holosporales bacterium]